MHWTDIIESSLISNMFVQYAKMTDELSHANELAFSKGMHFSDQIQNVQWFYIIFVAFICLRCLWYLLQCWLHGQTVIHHKIAMIKCGELGYYRYRSHCVERGWTNRGLNWNVNPLDPQITIVWQTSTSPIYRRFQIFCTEMTKNSTIFDCLVF